MSVAVEARARSTPDAELSHSVAGIGPAVFAIQGAGVPGSGWRPQVEGLAHHFRLITFDNRGIGKSSPGKDPLTNLGGLFGRDLADQPPIISAQLHAMSQYSAVRRLRELSGIPTLVISGAHDPIAPPACGKEIASLIRAARFIEFPDASHALPIQCAAEVNSVLYEHLTAASSYSAVPFRR